MWNGFAHKQCPTIEYIHWSAHKQCSPIDTYLVLYHQLMALHHQLKLVPPSFQFIQLVHSSPCHRTKKFVLALYIQEERFHLGEGGQKDP